VSDLIAMNYLDTINRLDHLLNQLVKRMPQQQAIVSVESGDESFRWTGAAGSTVAGESVVGDTPFFIASIDKLYNATIAMMLAEGGKLNIDESICQYLPQTLVHGLHYYGGRDRTPEITVRHLLTHSSGLPDWLEDYPKGRPSLVDEVFKTGDRKLTVEELIDHVRGRLRPHFAPQDLKERRPYVRYSDTNFILLAEIIEAVTDSPLKETHQRMLYEPLGLHQTCFAGHGQAPCAASAPMMLRLRGEPLRIPLLMQSVKGIYSTAAEMMRFLRQLMNGSLFRLPETLAVMTSSWHRFGFPLDRAALRSPNWPIEYGIGMMRLQIPRLFTPLAPVPAVMGHTGSTGCWLFYCPELDVLLAGSVEEVSAGAVPFRITPRILSILRESGWKNS
jgi:D-alanyl-D-alanine carboxypeptidase